MLKENFYLFLDIDGVLYDITWIKKEFDSGNISVRDLHTFKPESVSALNFLISKLQEKFNVDLVICSTWRINMKDTVCTLYKNGLKNFKEIHSTGFSFNEADREEEIFKYLQDKPNNQNIVIIDDESFNYKKYFPQSKIIKPSIYSNSLSFQMVNEFLINNQINEFNNEK